MLVVGSACASAAIGLATRTRWGRQLALGILIANLIGDLLNAFCGTICVLYWIADWRRDDRLLADRAKIAFGRARDGCFGVGQNVGLPPIRRKFDRRKWFDRIGDAANCGWPERD